MAELLDFSHDSILVRRVGLSRGLDVFPGASGQDVLYG